MPRRRSGKPVPGVDEWDKIDKSYGGDPKKYYEAEHFGTDGYYSVYNTLARKYNWQREKQERTGWTPSGQGTNVERMNTTSKDGRFHVTVNRYYKDDSKVQVLICDFVKDETYGGNTHLNNVDQYIADQINEHNPGGI